MTVERRTRMAIARDILAQSRAFRPAMRGSVAVEYGLIAALVVVAIIVALTQVRDDLLNLPIPTLITAFTDALS